MVVARLQPRSTSLADMILFQLEENPIHTVSLIGRMGRGKTNTMRYLSQVLSRHGYRCFYVSAPEPRELVELLDELRGAGDRLALFVDDISFIAWGRSDEVKHLENAIARARHILGTGDQGRLLLAFGYHYQRAINPFLRLTDTILLFDLTSKEEVEMYSERFSKRMLWEFYRIYDAYVWRKPKLVKWMERHGMSPRQWRPVLAKVVNRELVAWIPYTPQAEWEELSPTNGSPTGTQQKTPPPVTWEEFREKARQLGIRARNEKLHKLYAWIFYEKLGYKSRNPPLKEDLEDYEGHP